MANNPLTNEMDYEAAFNKAKSYNSAIITVGYGTFFACLFYLSRGTGDPLVSWALVAVVASATFFVAYEIASNIWLAKEFSKSGQEGGKFYRFWPWFFVPALASGFTGLVLLVWLLVAQFGAEKPGPLGLFPGDKIRVGFMSGTGAIDECEVVGTGEGWISVERVWFEASPPGGPIKSRGELRRSEVLNIPTTSIRAIALLKEDA